MRMNRAFIALGTNIEPRYEYLQKAIQLLREHDNINVLNLSSIYETKPVGYTDQDSFLNMVIEIETDLNPQELLNACQQIESNLGRVRLIKWGPRTIDLDILVYNQESINTESLTVPHPRMLERAFVLIPLFELDQSLHINGHTLDYYVNKLQDEDRKGVIKWNKIDGEEELKPFES
jgi:2-amino-4-hydroxy-6-hydroxymethyldihydropteridine diphosphokinase